MGYKEQIFLWVGLEDSTGSMAIEEATVPRTLGAPPVCAALCQPMG
jgi:hypothetical protein